MELTVVQRAEKFVKQVMATNDPSHDWLHVKRVRNASLQIALKLNSTIESRQFTVEQLISPNVAHHFSQVAVENIKKIDLLVVELAALLHDTIDVKYCSEPIEGVIKAIGECVFGTAIDNMQQDTIFTIIRNMSFRKELENPTIFTTLFDDFSSFLAFACVQDADRIDAIGAVGIARCFTFGATKSTPFYDESDKDPDSDISFEKYTSCKNTTTIAHFYEKLFKLANLTKTMPGYAIASERTETMRWFVAKFQEEISHSKTTQDHNCC